MNKISKIVTGISISASSVLASATQALAANTGIDSSVQIPSGFFFEDADGLISTILRSIMLLSGLLVFLYLIWGGIEWITSGGDKGKTENARNKITAAIIGLVILAASYAIFQLVLKLLGVDGYNEIFA